MKKQDVRNHVRYYVPHHFVFYPLLFALILVSIVYALKNAEDSLSWKLFALTLCLTGWLSYMMRQHYSLTLQNRIVRLEMRLRYYQLTGKRFEEVEPALSFSQIAALRFSADDEFQSLLNKAISDKLSPAEIKKQIRNWNPDHMRV